MIVSCCGDGIPTIKIVQYNYIVKQAIKVCKIKIRRLILHCGMHSHASAVSNGFVEFIQDVGRSACQEIHRTRKFEYQGIVMTNLATNSSTTYVGSFSGWTDNSGWCGKSTYKDRYGSWSDVQVSGQIDVLLREETAHLHIDENTLVTSAGFNFKLSEGCMFKSCRGHQYVGTVSPQCNTPSHKM
jgi:hypothetical protein